MIRHISGFSQWRWNFFFFYVCWRGWFVLIFCVFAYELFPLSLMMSFSPLTYRRAVGPSYTQWRQRQILQWRQFTNLYVSMCKHFLSQFSMCEWTLVLSVREFLLLFSLFQWEISLMFSTHFLMFSLQAKDHAKMGIKEVKSRLKQKVLTQSRAHTHKNTIIRHFCIRILYVHAFFNNVQETVYWLAGAYREWLLRRA